MSTELFLRALTIGAFISVIVWIVASFRKPSENSKNWKSINVKGPIDVFLKSQSSLGLAPYSLQGEVFVFQKPISLIDWGFFVVYKKESNGSLKISIQERIPRLVNRKGKIQQNIEALASL